MLKRVALLVLLAVVAAAPAGGQDGCPCVPIGQIWVTTACETFDCAISAMVVGGGSPYIVAVPTGGEKYKWVVVKRVPAGSAVIEPPDAFVVDTYPTMSEAAEKYGTLQAAVLPQLLTTIDGKSLVVRLREPEPAKKRAAHR
jgi:hypothetical protein